MHCSLAFVVWFLASWPRASSGTVLKPGDQSADACDALCGCVGEYHLEADFQECVVWHHGRTAASSVDTASMDIASQNTTSPTHWSSTPTLSSRVSSSTVTWPDNCHKGGPCDCDDIEDDDDWAFFQCVTNPACEHCWIDASVSTSASKTSPLSKLAGLLTAQATWITSIVTTTTSTSTSSTRQPPDNCYIGGPCDCSLIKDKNSDRYFQCVTNPACEHCWMNNSSLTTRSSTPTPTPLFTSPLTPVASTTRTTTLTSTSISTIILSPPGSPGLPAMSNVASMS